MGTTVVTGVYGSGKTEFCVNLALRLRHCKSPDRRCNLHPCHCGPLVSGAVQPETCNPQSCTGVGIAGQARNDGDNNRNDGSVTIADLDVINPYFRSREKAAWLCDLGVDVMGDCLNNNTGQDLPAVSFGFLSRVRSGQNVVVDLAGGRLGLNLLASCYDALRACPGFEFLCVLNAYRRETSDGRKMADFVNEINSVSKIAVTGLVNNGHMLRETAAEHVLASQTEVLKAAEILGLPVKFTMLRRDIYAEIKDEIKSREVLVFDHPIMRESWQ